jgi:hypothetical protein
MADDRAKLLAGFVEPLRVEPGAKVRLAKDFDPGYKASFLTDNGFKVVKLFLNLSKEEQRIRFLRRVDLPEKNWKFSAADARERKYWDDYQAAFSDMLSNTSTEWAPWYVIPADHKWFARICVSAVLALTLMDIDPRYPQVDEARKEDLAETRALLEAEAPEGAAADPAKAELAAKAKKERAAKESKQGRKQRERMKKVREDLREARHGR